VGVSGNAGRLKNCKGVGVCGGRGAAAKEAVVRWGLPDNHKSEPTSETNRPNRRGATQLRQVGLFLGPRDRRAFLQRL
jgi:hypothetical protein